jgi:hypothetical protein
MMATFAHRINSPLPQSHRRGGWRQQQELAARMHAQPRVDICKTACGMLRSWADGHLSTTKLHRHMQNMVDDGFLQPAVIRLASIGKRIDDRHCLQNLIRLLYDFGVGNFLSPVSGGGELTHILRPSTLFSTLLRNAPLKFTLHVVGGSRDRVLSFWQGLASSQQGAELFRIHPDLRGKRPEDLKRCIPVRVWEDAGPFTKSGGSVNVFCWSSLIGKGKDSECKFIVWCNYNEAGQPPNENAWSFLFRRRRLAVIRLGRVRPAALGQ